MTAVRCAPEHGACHLVLGGDEPKEFTGNLVLDRLFGARIHFTATDDWTVWQREVRRCRRDWPKAYAIPIGGSTPVGALWHMFRPPAS
jgi:D-cysteine desulfhydrase